MKKLLLLGASGGVAPFVVPGLEERYELRLADISPYPDGRPIDTVDITRLDDVVEASKGVDAILNFTVIRGDPVQSFHVNVLGAWHVMQAAARHGIGKVIHTGPQLVREDYEWDFEVDDVPARARTGYYTLTKMLSMEICEIFARAHAIHTICFVFAGLGPGRRPEPGQLDFPPFYIVWEDLQHACRLAIELDEVPGYFQSFDMLSYTGHRKYSADKARRILGFEPLKDWNNDFKRPVT